MCIKKYNSKAELIAAIKKATEQKRIWTEQVQSGRSVSALKEKGFNMITFN